MDAKIQSHLNSFYSELARGEIDSAAKTLQHLSRLASDHRSINIAFVNFYMRNCRWNEAVSELFYLYNSYQDDIEILSLLSACLSRSGNLTSSIELLKRCDEISTDSVYAKEVSANVLLKLGRLEDAVKKLSALASEDNHPWAADLAVDSLIALRDFESARSFLQHSALETDRKELLIACVDYEEQAFEEALARYRLGRVGDDLTIQDEIRHVWALMATDIRASDAGCWDLHRRFPDDEDVRKLMAQPPLNEVSAKRERYFAMNSIRAFPDSAELAFVYYKQMFDDLRYEEIIDQLGSKLQYYHFDQILQLMFASAVSSIPGASLKAVYRMIVSAESSAVKPCPAVKQHLAGAMRQERRQRTRPSAIAARPSKSDIRIALCISGQMRGYTTASRAIRRHITDKYDCDVFVHTWDSSGNAVGAHGARLHRALPPAFAAHIPNSMSNEDFSQAYPRAAAFLKQQAPLEAECIESYYANSICRIESESEFESAYLGRINDRSLQNQYKMFYKMKRVFEFLQTQSDIRCYDLVVWIRPDLEISSFVIEDALDKCIDKNFMISSFTSTFAFGDFAIAGRGETMLHLSQIWDQILDHGDCNFGDFVRPGWGPMLLFNYLFSQGIRTTMTEMFGANGIQLIGQRPDEIQFLINFVQDVADKQDVTSIERAAARTLSEAICRDSVEGKRLHDGLRGRGLDLSMLDRA